MKKLLIAMSAAAMFSLCAKAETTALLGGTDFESYEVGVPITTAQEGGLQFWTNASVGTTNETVNVGGESQIAVEGDGESANKYLKVDTTETLVRQTAELNASEIAPVSITNADVVVSAKVQFTAADEAPEAAEGDKLIVWAKAPAEDAPEGTKPTLCVTDGTASDENPYIDTEVAINPEQWYELEIKATKAGSGLTKTASFDLFLDGTKVGTYASRVIGGDACQTIASIGFKGTGAVDNIVFAKSEAVVVPDVTVAVSAPKDVTIYIDDNCSVKYTDPLVVSAGDTVTVYVEDLDNSKLVTSSIGQVGEYDEDNTVWPITYTTSADNLSVTMTITVTDKGDKTPITAENVTLSATEAVYTESLQLPTVTVVVGGTTLTENTDYTVSWVPAAITAAGGTYTVTVTGTGAYTGTVVKTFTVTPAGGSYPSYIGDDTTKKGKYDTWKAAMVAAGVDVGNGEAYEDAYLLNCTPADVETEVAAFKFTKIAFEGGIWVTATTTKNTSGADYNGTVTVTRYSDVGCQNESETGTFFKATLE